MKEKKSLLSRIPTLAVLLLLMTCSASIYHAFREVWVFYDPNLKFLGGAMGLFLVLLAVIALLLVLLWLRLNAKTPLYQKRGFRILALIALILTVLVCLCVVAICVFSGPETNRAMLLYLKKDLPVILAFCAAVLLLLAVPACKGKGRHLLAGALAVCMAGAALWQIFPLLPYRILSDPLVLDTGEDYAVVFATNAEGTGFVEYSFAGQDCTVYAQRSGRRIGERMIHSIRVPYEHLKNNSYAVGSTRVLEEFSYGSRLGKTVKSDRYAFRAPEGETQTYLVVSDWHSYLKQAEAAVKQLGAYDAVLLMGDPAAGMDFEEEAAENLVAFGGRLTGGTMPAIYVRGNHETRGPFADALPEYLGYDQLYYTVERGPYAFLVLDSGEDKPDDHVEYGGMTDYQRSREEMAAWLAGVQITAPHVIALSHAWQVSEPELDLSRAIWNDFLRLGVRFEISGHTHACRFLDGASPEEQEYLDAYPSITTYLDGGHSGKTFVASRLTLSPDGVRFEAADQDGTRVMDQTLPW
ncbi:MAG: metallophosphoesterase [Clostridia bacterium]|nr:metallophosphoesterase [Clostridia bacterium]